MFLNLAKSVIDRIYPFYSSAIILFVIFILMFFILSSKKGIKIFFMAFSFAGIIAAIIFSIISFIYKGSFSNYLFSYDLLELIKTCLILFISLNLLIFISFHKFENSNFIKILAMFLACIAVYIFYIPSSNFIMIFSSLALTVSGIFMVFTSLNNDVKYKISEEYIIKSQTVRFFLVSLFAIILMFLGFSFIFGATDLKSFVQIIETEKITSPIVKTGLFVLFGSVFIFLFIFPLQSAYIRLMKRCESSSAMIVWFLYFPAGLFLFLKLRKIFLYFAGDNFYLSIALYLIAFICIIAGNIGAIKTFSIRRISSFVYLVLIGFMVMQMAFCSSGLIDGNLLVCSFISNILLLIFIYFSFNLVSSELEKATGTDDISNFRSIYNENKYISLNLMIILLIFPLVLIAGGCLSGNTFIDSIRSLFNANTAEAAIKLEGYNRIISFTGIGILIFGIIFLLINSLRIVIIMCKSSGGGTGEKVKINNMPKFYYFYITLCCLTMLFLLLNSYLVHFNVYLLPPGFFSLIDKL